MLSNPASSPFLWILSQLAAHVMATVEKGQPTAVPDTERDPNYGQGQQMDQSETDRIIKGDKVELQDSDAWECLGYSFKTWRKW